MKKILFLCLVGLCSCANNQDIAEISNDVVNDIEINILPLECDVESRLLLTTDYKRVWESNDTVGIFPNKGGQVEFPIAQENLGTTNAKFTGGGWGLKSGYTYSAYYPYNFYNRDATQIPFSYEGQVQNGSDTREHLSRFLLGVSQPSEVSNGALNFSMVHKAGIFTLTLTLPAAKTYTSLQLYADSEIIPIKKTFNILSPNEKVEDYSNCLTFGLENITTTTENQNVVIWMAFPSMSQSTKTLKAIVKDNNGYVYVGDVTRLNAKNGSFDFYLDVVENKYYRLKASPVLSDGVSAGIEDWEIGEEILGSAN